MNEGNSYVVRSVEIPDIHNASQNTNETPEIDIKHYHFEFTLINSANLKSVVEVLKYELTQNIEDRFIKRERERERERESTHRSNNARTGKN